MTDVQQAASVDDGLVVVKAKRPRITLEPYDERRVEVIHDDGQEIYEPYAAHPSIIRVPTLSEKFLQLVHKVRAQQQEQLQQQAHHQQQQEEDKAERETTNASTVALKHDHPITHFLHMARIEVEFMGHALDMIRDGLYMLPHVSKAHSTAVIQVNEIAVPLEGKRMVLQRAAERIRRAAHSLEETIAKDHEGYLPSLLALRSRWRFHASATHSTTHGISHKIAVDYGHSTIGGPTYPPSDLPEAAVARSKDDGGLELSFKKTPDVDLHLVLSLRGGQGTVGTRGQELVLSARSLSAVGPKGSDGDRTMADRQSKLRKSVKKLIRAHECQFNEELFQKLVHETESKDDKRIGRARFIEDAIQIDSGHFGSGSCLSIRKGTEGNYSHNAPPLHQLHLPQVLLIAARRLYLAQLLQSTQQMQTLTLRPLPSTSSSNTSSTSVLGSICDIFLHIDLRTDVVNTLETMAESFPIAIHWTAHGPSKSSCVIRNSHNHTNFHITATPLNTSHNSTPTLTQIHTYTQTRRKSHTTEVDGGVIVYVSGREITCTISSCTMRVVNPRELVGFIKNYFRFL